VPRSRPSTTAPWVAVGIVAAASAALVLMATRHGLRLSPDSITYLAVADHIRHGRGLTDFTGGQLTVFGPMQPFLLAPGGADVTWARLVQAVGLATSAVLMFVVLRRVVGPWFAVVGAVIMGASQCLLLVASSAYSETPYIAFSLGVFAVLLPQITVRRCAVAGALAALGFLTRYAGLSLLATGLVVVLMTGWAAPMAQRVRQLTAYLVAGGVLSGAWVLHNLVVAGQPLGPRFEGGTVDSTSVLLRRPFTATGQALLGQSLSQDAATRVGQIAMVLLIVAVVVWISRGTIDAIRAGMVVYAATNFVLPVIARALTSNDISSRVMAPMLIPAVYIAVVAAGTVSRAPVVVARGGAVCIAGLAALWVWQGVRMVDDVPHLGSSGSRTIYSEPLHDLIDALPDDAQVLTNNPWGVWWQNRREPTLFAFTRPRAGNSHFPIPAERLLHLACTQPTYLAWFPSLMNAGEGPQERRPELLDVVDLVLEQSVTRGELYRVQPHDAGACA
jgi:hypothetical protein